MFRDFGGVGEVGRRDDRRAAAVEGEGVGAVRTLALAQGNPLRERLVQFDDGAIGASATRSSALRDLPVDIEAVLAHARSSRADGATLTHDRLDRSPSRRRATPRSARGEIVAVNERARCAAGQRLFVNAPARARRSAREQLGRPGGVEVLARAEPTRARCRGSLFPLLAEPTGPEDRRGPMPLNVMASRRSELRALGVRRLSAGSGVAQVALARAQAAVERFLVDGESARLLATPTKLKGHERALESLRG